MNLNVDNFLNFGPALCLGLAAIGSSIGCGLAGMTSHGAMAKVEEGHAKFVALSAMPASQSIYGFALMILLQQALKTDPSKGFAIFGIGLACGLAFMVSAIFQGKACSSAILAVSKKPSVFGMSFAAPGIVESFALFALVGGIMMR
ncbi:ATP synthase subunit C [bacterium]|nr:ATP synthase subunit C [bacterium]